MYSELFSPIKIGQNERPNRIFMAPMTRGRAGDEGIPGPLMLDYYQQRASAGLIITEACAISRAGYGWPGSPGIWDSMQIEAWAKITQAVSKLGGSMFLQLWHMGRCTHPEFYGLQPIAPSAITADAETYTASGKTPYVLPRAMTVEDIQQAISDYVQAARNALDAGFDGVELHGGGGYLVDQFIRDGSNKRTDQYGGSKENRVRFLLELVSALCKTIGSQRVAVRLAPKVTYNDIFDSTPVETFSYAAESLNKFDIAFLDIIEGIPGKSFLAEPGPAVTPTIREKFQGVLIANGGYDAEYASESIRNGDSDAIAFGVPFIANPDLVDRIKQDAPFQSSDPNFWYVGGPQGYSDFPVFDGNMNRQFTPQQALKPNEL